MTELTIQQRRDRFLEVVHDARDNQRPFFMGDWINTRSECGTTACAAGYGMLDPELAKAGLGARIGAETYFGADAILKAHQETPNYFVYPAFGNDTGIEALAQFFGISEGSAKYCFYAERYGGLRSADVTLDMVIGHIKAIFAHYPA